jgi:hypothetical protein
MKICQNFKNYSDPFFFIHFPVCTLFLATDPGHRGMKFLCIIKNNVSRTIKHSRDADINWRIILKLILEGNTVGKCGLNLIGYCE